MKISLQWLSDFVEIKDYLSKPEALADLLTKAGLEVEEISQKAKDFAFVVTGIILEKDKHPNADKLSVCKVMTTEGVVHQIVCGAQNHMQNDKVVVALPGAVLPGGVIIKNASVRGVESGGMLCSQKELGLAKESNGIYILPHNAPIGANFSEVMGYDDVTFELKVTPNRADCLSHFGLAREVACLLSRPFKKQDQALKISAGSTKSLISLEVKSEHCPRYAGRYIRGVKVADSPEWLKKRLESVDLKPINNVVDATNYVMMELGQPLHAFDAREIKGAKIIVDLAKANEKFTSLDGTEFTLTGEELMIRDGERAVAMAGVVGGKNSGVQLDTTDLFIEAAYFTPITVRKASRAHGISTDSSYRFSRGVDAENTLRAMDRAVEVILQLAGGEALGEPHDYYPKPEKKSAVEISIQTITDRLGYPADALKFEDFMLRLGCEKLKLEEGKYQILPPTFRFDLETEIDLVEEYARLNGYDQIPETLPAFSALPSPHDANYILNKRSSEILRATGYSQAVNMCFASQNIQQKFLGNLQAMRLAGLDVSEAPISILNPLTVETNCLRLSLTEGLFKNVQHNFHQGVEVGRLFEIGKAFMLNETAHFAEQNRLALIAWGQQTHLWSQDQKHALVFEVKSALEQLLNLFHIKNYQWIVLENRGESPDFLHQRQNAFLQVEGKNIGFVGSLHPELLEENKIRVPVASAEINLDLLFKASLKGIKIETFSRFQKIQRDLSLVMPKPLKAGDIIGEMKLMGGPNLTRVEIFDLYEGDKLTEGQKSVAFRLSYQDKNATLQDQTVNDSVEQILQGLKNKFAITVR